MDNHAKGLWIKVLSSKALGSIIVPLLYWKNKKEKLKNWTNYFRYVNKKCIKKVRLKNE